MDFLSWFDADHSYAHHWSEHYLTNTTQILPLKHLKHYNTGFSKVHLRQTKSFTKQCVDSRSENDSGEDSDEEIDVCNLEDDVPTIGSSSWHCAEQKVRTQMNECERHVSSFSRSTSQSVDMDKETYWEESINKSQWNERESFLFDQTLNILMEEKLSRMAYKGSPNEIVLRRLSVDRSASRLRNTFADFSWQLKLTQWLHNVLMENLPSSLLACYLDVMQTLRSKVPTLVERIIMSSRDVGVVSSERLGILLKRPWDPAVTAVVSTPKQKPSQPILFIVVQCSAIQSSLPITSRRLRFWNTLLSQIGKVAQVVAPSDESNQTDDKPPRTVDQLSQVVFKNVCSKVRELTARHPSRKVVLVGWNVSSIINCQVALKEEVAAVICMGFPMFTMFGKRGDVDDILCEVTSPILFVVGDRASYCNVNDLEDAREKFFTDAVTSSIVVGGADDWLRVSANRKRLCVITQPMVDRKILEGICDFLNIIFSPSDSFSRSSATEIGSFRKRPLQDNLEIKAKRRRSASPHVVLHRHTSTSAQINQLLSEQKFSSEQDVDASNLHGLSFNLKTGSVSALPGSAVDGRAHSSSPIPKQERHSLSKSKQSQQLLSRSITIDLTKESTDDAVPAPISRHKSQLLQPTEKQTQAAIAAILNDSDDKGSDEKRSDERIPPTSQTAIMTLSSSFSRYVSKTKTVTSSSSMDQSAQQSSTLIESAFGKKNDGGPTARTALSDARTGFKPIQPSLDRFSSIDHSMVSRTRKEDRETLQATSILERLTSSFDAENNSGNRPGSPEVFPDEFSIKRKGHRNVTHRRSSDIFSQTSAGQKRTGRVRTRGGHRGSGGRGSLNADRKANAPEATKVSEKTVVRYVVTPSRGTTQKRGTPRKITLMPEFGSSIFGTSIKPASGSIGSSGLRQIPSSRTTMIKTPSKMERSASSSTLSDAALMSYSSEKKSASVSSTGLLIAPSSKSTTIVKPSAKEVVKHVVYLKEQGGKTTAQQRTKTLVSGGSKTIAKVVTGKSGDRTLLSITRPRQSSGTVKNASVSPSSLTAVIGQTKNSSVGLKSTLVEMPSLSSIESLATPEKSVKQDNQTTKTQ